MQKHWKREKAKNGKVKQELKRSGYLLAST
jgi:hypothetical protein